MSKNQQANGKSVVEQSAGVGGARESGTIKWFNVTKGYGFATRPGGQKDVFVHANNLPDGVDDLKEGQVISFDLDTTPKGVKAVNIALVNV